MVRDGGLAEELAQDATSSVRTSSIESSKSGIAHGSESGPIGRALTGRMALPAPKAVVDTLFEVMWS